MPKGWFPIRPAAGFSLVEVLLAGSIFAMLTTIFASSYLYGQESTVQAGNRARATLLAEEGLEAVRNIRDASWNSLTYAQTGLSAGTFWSFLGEATSETVGIFTRTIAFGAVCRDSGDAVADCPADHTDADTKRVTATVAWQYGERPTSTVALDTYITNWHSQNWIQTDWSGGSGQSVWSDTTKYQTDDAGLNVATAGQVTLGLASENWILAAGSALTDETDTDFSAGTLAQTVIEGSGTAADVVLDQSEDWLEHADSGVVAENVFSIDAVSASDIWAVGAGGKIIHYNGTTWSEFADMGTNINGVDMLTASDGWAVGNSGKFYHYNGTSWSEFVDLGATAVNAVTMLTASDGWAVADSSKFYHYNGTTWSEFVDLGGSTILSVSAVSSTDIHAVGASGKFYHYNGTTWSETQDIGGTQINDVFMVTASDGWTVGNGGVIYHYNGTTWSSQTSPVVTDLQSVFMVTASDGWVVGASGKILHYNGTSWSEDIDIGGTALNGVFFINTSNGWVVGNAGMIEQYAEAYLASGVFTSRVHDGGVGAVWATVGWTETLPTGADVTIATRSGSTSTPDGSWSAWSTEKTDPGGSDITSPDAQFIQYRITFTRGTSPLETPSVSDVSLIYNSPTGSLLNDVWAVSASDIWAVGNAGVLVHYNGTAWALHGDSGVVSDNLNAVNAVAATDAWAVGDSGKFVHYNGTNWSEFVDLGATAINDVAMVSATDGWATGNSGKFYHYNGTAWSEFVDLGAANVFALVMASSTDGWAVGADGDIYHYNGTTWSVSTSLGTNINGLSIVSASDIWAVGNSGKFYHYNGTSWSEVQDVGTVQMNDVYMISASLGWAVGESGDIYKYTGISWSSASSPTNKNLSGLFMVSATNGWAVGAGGTIIHYMTTGTYTLEGLLTSSAFDTGAASFLQVVDWQEDISSCTPTCLVRMQIRGAPDSGGLPGTWSGWYGATGVGTYFTDPDGALVPATLNGSQWVQYRLELQGDGNTTPTVTEVRVNYK